MIVSRHVVFDEDNFPLAASPSLTDLDFLCESGPMVSTIGTHLTTVGTSPPAPCWPAPEIPLGFEPTMANLPALVVPPCFLPQRPTMAAPPTVTNGPPPRTWPASPVTYIRREVGAGAAGTRGDPRAALRREVGAGATGPCGALGAAPSPEVGVVAAGTRGSPEAVLRREVGARAAGPRGAHGAALCLEVGAGAVGTRGAPRAALRQEVGAGAVGTHGAPGAALHRQVGARAAATCGGLGAALSREVGARATVACGGPGAALSREAGTTPPLPLPRPFTRGQGMVVPATSPDNPHQMITRGKTIFRVLPDRLVLTTATSSLTPSPIPSSARAALVDPH
jgi:hypothetical protein